MSATLHTDNRPLLLWTLFAVALVLNAAWYFTMRQRQAMERPLPPIPSVSAARVMSLGEEAAAAKGFMLWLQAFDNQPGVSVPFKRLDYDRLVDWLTLVESLDARSHYPLLAASRIYTSVDDAKKLEAVMEYVYSRFQENPARNWPWLAQVAVLAKHRLHDHQRALKYANAIADSPRDIEIPAWARQLSLVLLEEKGELETLRVLIGGLLVSGQITDVQEKRYLELMLERMEAPDSSQQPKRSE